MEYYTTDIMGRQVPIYKGGILPEVGNDKLIIKPSNSHYGIDPIGDIKEWFGILYGTNLKIKKIILSGPATIIFWNDGTKTVVKAQDEIDYEKGILYAALKKLATKKEYNDILRAIDELETKYVEEVVDEIIVGVRNLKKEVNKK